ncbi:hypothetical protein DM533_25135 [Salmonella enterica]|nr:hypothetical protein [Salmonella enterica]
MLVLLCACLRVMHGETRCRVSAARHEQLGVIVAPPGSYCSLDASDKEALHAGYAVKCTTGVPPCIQALFERGRGVIGHGGVRSVTKQHSIICVKNVGAVISAQWRVREMRRKLTVENNLPAGAI